MARKKENPRSRKYIVTYRFQDEDDFVSTRQELVTGKNKDDAVRNFHDMVRYGDETIWGDTQGSSPERANGMYYLVFGDEYGDSRTRTVEFEKIRAAGSKRNPTKARIAPPAKKNPAPGRLRSLNKLTRV
jgi:hypothetical protein